MIDHGAETTVKGSVILGLTTSLFKGFGEDELIESTVTENFVDAFEFAAVVQIIGAWTQGHFWDWTKRQGMAF